MPQQSSESLNERLTRQYTEIATLAGGLAHEIKNPLSTIRLNLELLAEDFATPETPKERRALQKIGLLERECLRLQNLLDDFLRFTKVRQLNLQSSNLNEEIQKVLEFFAPKAQEAKIDITCFLEPDLPKLQLDREAINAVMLNLVLNAQQAMPQGGKLAVRTRILPGAVALDLIDTGTGMDEETQARIFEAFYSTKPGGSGLGLATARKIVEAHGGRIDVQSQVGQGTWFMLVLPSPARIAPATKTEPIILDAP